MNFPSLELTGLNKMNNKNLLTASCSNADQDVLGLCSSWTRLLLRSREKVAGALKLKQTSIFVSLSLSRRRRRKTKERRKHNDGLVGTSVIVLPLLYMLYGISAGPAEMRQMLVHFRVSEKSNKKQDNGKEKLKKEKKKKKLPTEWFLSPEMLHVLLH